MSRIRMRTQKVVGTRIDGSKLENIFFANEFPLSNPSGAYIGVKFAIDNDQTCTKISPGLYEFPLKVYQKAKEEQQSDPVATNPQQTEQSSTTDGVVAKDTEHSDPIAASSQQPEAIGTNSQQSDPVAVKNVQHSDPIAASSQQSDVVVAKNLEHSEAIAASSQQSEAIEASSQQSDVVVAKNVESAGVVAVPDPVLPKMEAVDNPILIHFKRLLQFYEDKEELEIRRLLVHQTGIGVRGTSVHDYGQLDEEFLRIIINLRPGSETSTTGVRLNIKTATSWIITRRSYGTVLAGGLSNISISTGAFIPGTRHENGQSIFVIMDIKPLRATRANVADRLCAQSPIKAEKYIEGLRKSFIEEEPDGDKDSATGKLVQKLKDALGSIDEMNNSGESKEEVAKNSGDDNLEQKDGESAGGMDKREDTVAQFE